MWLFELGFDRGPSLERAFSRVMEWDRAKSCSVDSNTLRLLFVAPAKRADALVERIYLEGGLTWCSRHKLASESGKPDPPES